MAKRPTKTPATVERFRIHAETSKEHMGHVLAELTKMGLEHVGYELVTDVVTFRKNGPRKVRDVTGDDFARAFVKENASFAAIALVNHFRANDRPANSAYSAIRNLLADGDIKKLSPGNYQRAGVKALAPPAPKGKALKRRANKVHRYEIENRDVILKRIKGRGKFTLAELRDHFSNIRRNPKSVSPLLNALLHDKLITRLEDGIYAWSKKKKIAKKKIAVRKKRDAPVASPQLEETNG